MRDLLMIRPADSDLTTEQKYLRDLGAITEPVLSVYRTKNKLKRLQPRINVLNASFALEDCGRRLAMDAYHFKERVRLFAENCIPLVINQKARAQITKQIGRSLRTYARENTRLLKFRNFVVHGPRGRTDEFEDLRCAELAGILLHSDLWLEYKNVFEDVRCEWALIAKSLIRSMETVIAAIQVMNENMIESASLSFLVRPPTEAK